MNYFDDDINSEEIKSPREILDEAASELEQRTSLKIVIREERVGDRVILKFEAFNLQAKRSLTLCEVFHRTTKNYPALIVPPPSDIPNDLSRKKRIEGTANPLAGLSAASVIKIQGEILKGVPARIVDNPWVCATPFEFKAKLVEMFKLEHVKVDIISLRSARLSEEQKKTEVVIQYDVLDESAGVETDNNLDP